MSDATLPLQAALVNRLQEDTAVKAIINRRVYDAVPKAAVMPYVSFGPWQVDPEIAQEYEGSDNFIQIDGWAAGPQSVEVKRLGKAIRDALVAPLAVEGNRVIVFQVERTQYLRDPDGITQHAVISIRARTEPVE